MADQLSMFASEPALPEGFRYSDDVVAPADETSLLDEIRALPFKEFEFQGYLGRRRIVSFGWHYDFTGRGLVKANDIPPFLLTLRETAARFARIDAARLQHVLVTEYGAGAGIGWHRDKAVFGEIVGISLLAPCTFRLRRKVAEKWARASVIAAPRSAYLLSGVARTEWEHSIPAVDATRYSVTFRNLRDAG